MGIAPYGTSTGNVNALFKKGYTFSLFDDHIKQHFMTQGIDRSMGQAYLPGLKLMALETELQRLPALNSSELFGADSIAALAEKMAVYPTVLKTTIEQYNGFCEKGTLRTIREGSDLPASPKRAAVLGRSGPDRVDRDPWRDPDQP